jgi:transposase
MHTKLKEQKQAQLLRRKGLSLSEISKELKISKSSCSLWCRNIILPIEKQQILNQRGGQSGRGAIVNKLKRQKQLEDIAKQAIKNFDPIKPTQVKRLKDIGTVIYWAEGTKKNIVDITNSDPEMIKIAMLWLRRVCKVDEKRIRISIFYHTGQNEIKIKKYWSKITKIPLKQFNKSIFKKEGTGHRKNILYMGTCKIRICDRNLLHTILTWIKQLYLV